MEFESGQREPETWERVIDDCVARFHAATSAEEKSRLLVRVGQVLHAELGDDEQGYDALLEALRLDPSNDEAVGELAPLARRMRRWPQVVEALRGFLAEEEEPRRRIQLCEHAARWCKEAGAELGPDAADPFVVEIDRIDPSHWAVRRRLASLYREQGLWDLRREELDRALLRATTRDEVRDTRFALGELHEIRLEDRARATLHYEAALACDPQSVTVLAALVRVYEARELHDRLRDALTTLAALLPDPAEKGLRLVQLADVWERHFLKPARAASLLEEALSLVPGDAGALGRLEQCYRAMRAWPEYVSTLERRLELLSTRGERAAALVQIGRTYESALRDPARALAAYRRACVLDPLNAGALTELARSSERSDDWRTAADCRAKLATLAPAEEQAKLHAAVGALLEPPNRDPERARAEYARAAEIDPRLAAAWEGLQRLAEQEGDYAAAARFLAERIARADGRRAKARLSSELGLLWERAGALGKAIEAYEAAHETLPESAPIAHDLFRLYRDARKPASAAALCATLLRAAIADGDGARALDVLRASASVAAAADDPEGILVQAARVAGRFGDLTGVGSAFVDLAHALRDRADAAIALQSALDAAPLDPSVLSAGSLVKLGEVQAAFGDEDRAIDLFVEALSLDDACVPALRNLVEHFVAGGDLPRASSYRLWLARVTPDRRVRFTLLVDAAGDLFDAGPRDYEQAAWAYEEARAMEPRYRLVLDRLVLIYTALGDWGRLLDVQRSIADAEELPALRASRLRSMGAVARSKLGDRRAAAALFEAALDLEPMRLDAFEELAAIWKEEGNLAALTLAHARVLVRLDDVDRPLGQRDRTGSSPGSDPPASSRASGVDRPSRIPEASRTDGSGVVPIDALERRGSRESDARLRQIRARIAASPASPGPYRDLCAELRAVPSADGAWCAYSVLRHLGGTDEETERFVRSLGAPELAAAPGAVTEVDWYAALLHSGFDRALLAAMAVAAGAARRAAGDAHLAPGEPREPREPREPLSAKGTGKGARLAALVQNAARILRLPEPVLHERSGPAAPPIAVVAGARPEVVASFASIEGLPAGSLPFVVGRCLADLHPLLAVRADFATPSDMRALFESAVRAVSGLSATEDAASASLRAALTEPETALLAECFALVFERPDPPDFVRLHRLLEISATRAGMLLQGEIERTWSVIARELRQSSELPGADLREDLAAFAVSAEHLALRERAGLAVRAPGGDRGPRSISSSPPARGVAGPSRRAERRGA